MFNKLVEYRQYIPSLNNKIEEELSEITKKLKETSKSETNDYNISLSGKLSGAIYTQPNKVLQDKFAEAAREFSYINPLHSDVYKQTAGMEKFIIRYCCDIMHGTKDSSGVITSGGTESILLACKAYRDHWRKNAWFTFLRRPNIVVPESAHAAFDKAGQLMDIRIRKVPVDSNGEVTVNLFERYINWNTIAIAASAPSFPHGIIDQIEDISKMALKKGIPMHVDSCLGGFLTPFLQNERILDFRLPGVTSISMDTHKYGMAPKGSSVLLFSDKRYFRYTFSLFPNWMGGIYATPTLAGSRPGAVVASTYATIKTMDNEYPIVARKIQSIVKKLILQIRNDPDINEYIEVIGNPDVCVVAFRMQSHLPANKIYETNDNMTHLGWNLNNLQNPAAIHLCVTGCHFREDFVNEFTSDLKASLKLAINSPESKEGSAAIYGMSTKVPKVLVEELMCRYFEN